MPGPRSCSGWRSSGGRRARSSAPAAGSSPDGESERTAVRDRNLHASAARSSNSC
jgi:hypothetical protein